MDLNRLRDLHGSMKGKLRLDLQKGWSGAGQPERGSQRTGCMIGSLTQTSRTGCMIGSLTQTSMMTFGAERDPQDNDHTRRRNCVVLDEDLDEDLNVLDVLGELKFGWSTGPGVSLL